MKDGSNMTKGDYIPDIIVEILSKLPSKCVLRFKIVCKIWYSLISDPIFINLHSKRQPSKILFSISGSQIQLLDYESPNFNYTCLSDPIKFPGETISLNPAKIVGSSNGLVCVATDDCYGNSCYSIWNPSTGECRKIPKLCARKPYKHYSHGLSYDSVANDFKLVIWNRMRSDIFSLKANSWKKFKLNLQTVFDKENTLATVLNGNLYWVTVPSPSYPHQKTLSIVAFDAAKETFEKLKFPEHAPWNSLNIHARLLEHRGCLCLSMGSGYSYPLVMQMWTMKECGTWVHILNLENAIDIYLLPIICFSTTDEVVRRAGKKFSRSGREKDHEIILQRDVYGAISYVETLVSPNLIPIKQY